MMAANRNRLARLMVEFGVREKDLAAACSPPMAQPSLNRLRHGDVRPSLDMAWRVVLGLRRASDCADITFEDVWPSPQPTGSQPERPHPAADAGGGAPSPRRGEKLPAAGEVSVTVAACSDG